MEILHLPAMYKGKIRLTKTQLNKLPAKLGLVASIQFLDNLSKIKEQIPTAKIGGQVLGCRVESAQKISSKVDAFLFVGSGKFHPIGIYLKTKKPVYCFNPVTNSLTKLKKQDVENFEKKRKSALTKYLMSKKIGILLSLKSGQFFFNKAHKLIDTEKKKNPDKEFYIFVVDTVQYNELENFPFIDSWVNTGCPRISDEKIKFVNVDAIFDMYGEKTDEVVF